MYIYFRYTLIFLSLILIASCASINDVKENSDKSKMNQDDINKISMKLEYLYQKQLIVENEILKLKLKGGDNVRNISELKKKYDFLQNDIERVKNKLEGHDKRLDVHERVLSEYKRQSSSNKEHIKNNSNRLDDHEKILNEHQRILQEKNSKWSNIDKRMNDELEEIYKKPVNISKGDI